MALDNAQFISELSIVDPPGTDPLSQGDDQVRTIKRATQQSFPNIDAAVTLTPEQMNLAAIKNEQNVFTVSQTIQDNDLILNAVADGGVAVQYHRGGVLRWTLTMSLDAANNDWSLTRFATNGDFVDNPMLCDRATGVVNFSEMPTVQGAPLWIAGELRMFVANTTPGNNWFVADGTNGTVNLDNRILMAEGSSAAGTNLNPNMVGTTAGSGVTDPTTITEATMPSHTHDMKIADNGTVFELGKSGANQVVFGTFNSTLNKRFSNTSGGGERLIDDTGGGGSHTHGQNSVAVTENGTSRDTVRPLSRTVQYHQYVP
jgi:hypothetical protein